MSKLDLSTILLFTAIACALAWLTCLPLWLSGQGLADPRAALLLPLMMSTPAVTTLIMIFVIRPEAERVRALGLGLGAAGYWRYWAFGWLAIPIFTLGALPIAQLFGLYDPDLAELSGFRQTLEAVPQGAQLLEKISLPTLAVLQVVQAIVLAPVLNAVFTLGEELGWRGYLLPKLLPLGQWRALLISGLIWGLWHAPVILLGYNYPGRPLLGMAMMTILCVILGILFGWTRLATGSVWPAVIAHGSLNGSAGLISVFARAGTEIDPTQAGITGWSGWLLPILWIGGLVATRRLPCPAPDLPSASRQRTDEDQPRSD